MERGVGRVGEQQRSGDAAQRALPDLRRDGRAKRAAAVVAGVLVLVAVVVVVVVVVCVYVCVCLCE